MSSVLIVTRFAVPLLTVFTLGTVVSGPRMLGRGHHKMVVDFTLATNMTLVLTMTPNVLMPDFVPTHRLTTLRRTVPKSRLLPVLSGLGRVHVGVMASST